MYKEQMYEEYFAARVAALRELKGVSAREMSLSIGQNTGYINYIENGKALPSMSGFFYICEYLGISPCEFFDLDNKNPQELRGIISNLKRLTPKQLESISVIVNDLANSVHP